MDFKEIKVGPLGLFQLVALIGGILGVIAILLSWADPNIADDSYTGIKLIEEMGDLSDDGFSYTFAPLLALIFSIIALVFAIIPVIKSSIETICEVIGFISGLIVVIFTALWLTSASDGIAFYDLYHSGVGVYLMLAGGIVALVGAVVPLVALIVESPSFQTSGGENKLEVYKVGPFGIFQILALIGGILGVIAIFLSWADPNILGDSYTGIKLIEEMGDLSDAGFSYSFAPLLALIFSVLALVLTLILVFKPSISMICGIAATISGVIVVIFTALWLTSASGGVSFYDLYHSGVGVYLMLAGGIVALVGSVVPVVNDFLKNR